MVVSCRIASIFSETSRNLDMYLSVDNLRYRLESGCFYRHFRNILGNFLQDVCLQTAIHRIRRCVLIQPTLKICNDIASPSSDTEGRYSSGKTFLDFALDV